MFPTILKEYRRRNNVTQVQVAAAIGVSPGNVGDWETGKSLPGYKALVALAGYFEVSADQLLGLDHRDDEEEILAGREADLVRMVRELDERDREDIYDLTRLKYQRTCGRKNSAK